MSASQHISLPRKSSSMSSTSSTDSSMSSTTSNIRQSDELRSRPQVQIIRCSRCIKSVETITMVKQTREGPRRVSSDDSGMVQFGYNLYYCERCAKLVGYHWTITHTSLWIYTRLVSCRSAHTWTDFWSKQLSCSRAVPQHRFQAYGTTEPI